MAAALQHASHFTRDRRALCEIVRRDAIGVAIDANMRGFEVRVPADCCASPTAARNARALALLRDSLQLSTARGASVPVGA